MSISYFISRISHYLIRIITVLGIIFIIASVNTFAAFERVYMGGREAALGSAYTAISDDAEAIWYNPAGLRLVKNIQINTSYSELYSISSLGYYNLSLVLPTINAGAWGFGYSSFGSSEYKETDLRLSFSVELTPGIYFGSNLKRNTLSLGNSGGSAGATGFDIGVMANINPKLRMGFSSHNMNNPTLGDTSEELDKMMCFGLMIKPYENILVSVDMQKPAYEKTQLHAGAETIISEFFSLRTGIQMNPFKFSYGFGIDRSIFSFRYAAAEHSILDMQHVFSLIMNFGSSNQPRRRRAIFKTVRKRGPSFRGEVNINTADVRDLSRIPGISSVTAKKIIEYREKIGSYRSVKEVMNIYGMSKTKFDSFKNHLTIDQNLSSQKVQPAQIEQPEASYEEEIQEFQPEESAREVFEPESEAVYEQKQAQPADQEKEEELIDINYANVKELLQIKGITYPVARNIVKFRNSRGWFKNWESLENVPGVNKKILENMKKSGVLIQD